MSGVIPSTAAVSVDGDAITASSGAGNAGTLNFVDANASLIVSSGTFTNSGTINNPANGALVCFAGNFLNTGLFEATGGGRMWFNGSQCNTTPGTLENGSGGTISIQSGSFEVQTSMSLKLDPGSTTTVAQGTTAQTVDTTLDVAGGTISGTGTLAVIDGGALTFEANAGGGGAVDVTGAAPVTLSGVIPAAWTVDVDAGVLAPAAGATNDGTIALASGDTAIDAAGAFANNGSLTDASGGRALITATTLTNAGTISLTNPAAIMQLTGNLALSPSSTLGIVVAGTSAGNTFSLFTVSGAASLGGTLAVSRASAYTPATGDAQQFLTAGAVSGTFTTTTGGSGNFYSVQYARGSVTLATIAHAVKVTIAMVKVDRSHRTARITFSAAGAAGFVCALARSAGRAKPVSLHFTTCHSPATYTHLHPGTYTFAVRIRSAAGLGPVASTRLRI
jgi:autotransporter family porin